MKERRGLLRGQLLGAQNQGATARNKTNAKEENGANGLHHEAGQAKRGARRSVPQVRTPAHVVELKPTKMRGLDGGGEQQHQDAQTPQPGDSSHP